MCVIISDDCTDSAPPLPLPSSSPPPPPPPPHPSSLCIFPYVHIISLYIPHILPSQWQLHPSDILFSPLPWQHSDPEESVKVLVGTQSDRLDDEEDSIADRRLWEVSAVLCHAVAFLLAHGWDSRYVPRQSHWLPPVGQVTGDREQPLLQVREHFLLH